MIAERLGCQPNRFRNGLGGNVASPRLHDGFPGHPSRHLLHNVSHQDSGSSEGRLAVTDRRVGDDVPPNHPLGNLVLVTPRHGRHLKHNYRLLDPDGEARKWAG